MTPRLKVMLRAVEIRLKRGEKIEDILASYPRLSKSEKQILMKELAKQVEK